MVSAQDTDSAFYDRKGGIFAHSSLLKSFSYGVRQERTLH